jgi:hypothetical protein
MAGAGAGGKLARLDRQGACACMLCRALPQLHLQVVMQQIAASIAADPTSRAKFVQCGALRVVEELGGQGVAGIIDWGLIKATRASMNCKSLAWGPVHPILFMHSGAWCRDQPRRNTLPPGGVGEAPGSPFKEHMDLITVHFPEEIIKYYSPTYNRQLLSKLSEPVVETEQEPAEPTSSP